MKFWKYLFPAFVWKAIIAFLLFASFSSSDVPKIEIPFLDKIVHFLLFSILSLLYTWGLKKQTLNSYLNNNAFLMAIVISISYGLLTEVIQYLFIYDRFGELLDVVADSSGALLGVIGYHFIPAKIK